MVASDDCREKVACEISRPTFARAKSRHCPGSASSAPARKLQRGMEEIGRRKSPVGVSGDEGFLAKKSEVHEKIC